METRTEEKLLNASDIRKFPMAFVSRPATHTESGAYARSLASGYMKYTQSTQALTHEDSVNSFVALAASHQALLEQMRQFLREEVDFVYEDQPIQPLLLQFAAWRLAKASRTYTNTALKPQSFEAIDTAKAQVLACQAEYDALIQAL